jgi:hypothetical protein
MFLPMHWFLAIRHAIMDMCAAARVDCRIYRKRRIDLQVSARFVDESKSF